MLMNNLDPEVAERPEDLVVYGGTGKAARDWECFDAIVATLRALEDDETLLVQSGKPVGVFQHARGRAARAHRQLQPGARLGDAGTSSASSRRLGLTMYGQMTAGSWIYIGTQGILQGTYETFAAAAAKHFGGTLRGTLTLTAGLGGMGGAQPLAVTMNEGVALCVEVDPERIQRRLEHALPRRGAPTPRRGAARWADEARAAGDAALASACCGNAADVYPGARAPRRRARPRHRPDLGPRPAERLRAARPDAGRGARSCARADPEEYVRRAMRQHGRPRAGDARAAEGGRRGLRLRQQHPRRRRRTRAYADAFAYPRLRARLHPAALLRGQGAVPLGGALRRPRRHRAHRPRRPRDLPRRTSTWRAGSAWPASRSHFQGLPARICWLGYGERAKVGLAFNELVRTRRGQGADRHRPRPPRLRARSPRPNRETEAMKDGSDAIADWPLLNAWSTPPPARAG